MFTKTQQQGFTLIELMMTLVIATIMATVAIPGFNNLIQDNRLTTQTNNLVASLALARSESIKRGQPVTVCASSNGSSCNSNSYEKGWLVFSDTGTASTIDGTDQILRSQGKAQGQVDISIAGNSKVRYMATGMLASASNDSSLVADATTEFVPSWADRLVFNLLPGNMAMASGSGSTGSGSTGSGSTGSGSTGSGSTSSGSTGSGSTGSGSTGSGSTGACSGGSCGGSGSGGGSGSSGSVSGGSGSSGSVSSGSGSAGGSVSSGSGSGGSGSGSGSASSGSGSAGGSGSSGSGCDDGTSGAAGSSTFKVCDDRNGETGRIVTVSPTGRISSRKVSCS